MRKLPLIFRCKWGEKEGEIKELRRKFHTIIIESIPINEKLAETLRKLARNAKELEIHGVKITNGSLTTILNAMQKLENLQINNSTIDNEEFNEDTTPSALPSLKSFRLIKSDWGFFDFIRNTQVRSLKIVEKNNYTPVNAIAWKSFSERQTNLDSLAVVVQAGEFFIDLTKVSEKNRQLQLTKLALGFKHWGADPAVDNAFIRFIEINSTLKTLEISHDVSEDILESIIKKLKLKRLIIDANHLPFTPAFYRKHRPNKYLETLVIKRELDNLDVAQGLLRVFSSIEKLVIEHWKEEIINEALIFICNNCNKLRHLEIPKLSTNTPELAVSSLRTFRVDFVAVAREWQAFCSSNPSIENLIVKWTTNRSEFTYEVLDAVTGSLPNLKYILFGVYFKPTSRIIEMLDRNCKKIQLLEVFDDTPGDRPNDLTGGTDFRVRYYHRQAASQLFKDEPSMWGDSDIEESDDETGGRRNMILGDDFNDTASSSSEDMDTEDENFIDDGDAEFEVYGYGNFGNLY